MVREACVFELWERVGEGHHFSLLRAPDSLVLKREESLRKLLHVVIVDLDVPLLVHAQVLDDAEAVLELLHQLGGCLDAETLRGKFGQFERR